jgi:aryl-alcohol dehydrogenase (NADP+)
VERARLGTSDLVVSRLCIGTMTFGAQCDEATSFAVLDEAAAAGVNFIDTADVYPARGVPGESEEHVGRWLRGRRDHFVVATKCGGPAGPLDALGGCSRTHIERSVEGSLRRLGTDRIDLYQLHRFDRHTPVEETLEALDSLVRAGKVRHIGCSNWTAGALVDALGTSERAGWARFCSVQPRYNLLHRVPEQSLLPRCVEHDVGVIPYNPLAGGLLTGKHRGLDAPAEGTRFGLSAVYRDLYWQAEEFATVAAVVAVAARVGIDPATLAVAWLLARPGVTSAIIGASRPEQLAATLAGAGVSLDAPTIAELDRASAAHLDGAAL